MWPFDLSLKQRQLSTFDAPEVNVTRSRRAAEGVDGSLAVPQLAFGDQLLSRVFRDHRHVSFVPMPIGLIWNTLCTSKNLSSGFSSSTAPPLPGQGQIHIQVHTYVYNLTWEQWPTLSYLAQFSHAVSFFFFSCMPWCLCPICSRIFCCLTWSSRDCEISSCNKHPAIRVDLETVAMDAAQQLLVE
jgi:hypothetical protein